MLKRYLAERQNKRGVSEMVTAKKPKIMGHFQSKKEAEKYLYHRKGEKLTIKINEKRTTWKAKTSYPRPKSDVLAPITMWPTFLKKKSKRRK